MGVTGSWVVEVVVGLVGEVELELEARRPDVWLEECVRTDVVDVVDFAVVVDMVEVPQAVSRATAATTTTMRIRDPTNLLATRDSVARPGCGWAAPWSDRSSETKRTPGCALGRREDDQ